MIKRAFITGGAGFIGSNLAKLLTQDSFKVTVYDNLSTGYYENIENINEIDFIKGDILDYNQLIKSMRNHDVVFHLAANIGNIKSLKDPKLDSTINIMGTLNVLEACRINNIKKLIYSSSAAIFGELKYQPIDELHPLEPDSPYGVSKLAAEKHCMWYGKHNNIGTIALRYFNVYGRNQRYDAYGNVIPIWANALLKNKPITIYDDGYQTRDFVNVNDIAYANFLAASKSDIYGIYNIGSGSTITINELADLMIRIFNAPVDKIYKPPRKGEIRHCRANPKKAIQKLDFKITTDFETGLHDYYKWLIEIS